MLKEYIETMQTENQDKMKSLQMEMEEIVTDISNTQKLVERIQYEKKLDSNIFSPRKIDFQADDKISENQTKIKSLNQRMEYVGQMVEECKAKQEELNNLLIELEEMQLQKENESETDYSDDKTVQHSLQKQEIENKIIENNNENVEQTLFDQSELLIFIDEVYKHNEIALAMVNGNKNRCKSEIRKSMSMLRDFAKKVENGDT